MEPRVTVFMAVFNGELYLKASIQSVLSQSYVDFELLLINDGSTDGTVNVIQQFSDPRIRLISNDSNKGLSYTRALGLELARGKYFAILDSDDLAVPDRLKIQVDYLDNHPEVHLCGGHAKIIDEQGLEIGQMRMPIAAGDDMRIGLLFGNPFINSSLMIRRKTMLAAGGYKNFAVAEDFELSYRISLKFGLANLDRTLVHYRVHQTNISKLQSARMTDAEKNIIGEMQLNLGIAYDKALIELHHQLIYRPLDGRASAYLKLLEALKAGNIKVKIYPEQRFNEIVFEKWFSMIRKPGNRNIFSLYMKNRLFDWSFVTLKQLRKLIKQALFSR